MYLNNECLKIINAYGKNTYYNYIIFKQIIIYK